LLIVFALACSGALMARSLSPEVLSTDPSAGQQAQIVLSTAADQSWLVGSAPTAAPATQPSSTVNSPGPAGTSSESC